MTKEQLEIFKEFTYSYSLRFKYCFCSMSDEKNYPEVFTKNHWLRFTDYFDGRYNITVNPTDIKAYEIYKDIMVQEINKFIDECKQEQSKKDKESARNKQVKRKKD